MHFPHAISICFQLIFSAVLVCELSAAPAVLSRSLLTNFIELLEKEGCSPPVPPPFPQPSAAEPWGFLASPLRVCENADSKARLIFCEEIFEVLSNVTCSHNRTIHWQPIEVMEEVCPAFHQLADLLATTRRPDFLGHKLSDLVLCEMICSTFDMADACRLLLWAYQLERSMWEQVPPDKLSADLENPHDMTDIKHGNDVNLEDKQSEGNQTMSTDSNLEISNGNNGDISDKKETPQNQDHINWLTTNHTSPQPISSDMYLSHQKGISFKEQYYAENQIPDEELKKVSEVDQKNGSKNGNISKSNVNKMMVEDDASLKKKVMEQDEIDFSSDKGKEDETKLHKEIDMVREDEKENALNYITDSSEHLKKGNLKEVKLPDISKTTVKEIKPSNVTEQGAKENYLSDISKTMTKENQSLDPETPLSDPTKDAGKENASLEKSIKNPEESIDDSGNTSVLPSASEMVEDNKEEQKYGVAASTVAEKMDTDIVLEQQQNIDFEETVIKGESNNVEDGGSAVVTFEAEEDGHFLFYFLSIVLLVTAAYLLFHNKQKILALIVEGRGHERRRRNVTYRKLDTK